MINIVDFMKKENMYHEKEWDEEKICCKDEEFFSDGKMKRKMIYLS